LTPNAAVEASSGAITVTREPSASSWTSAPAFPRRTTARTLDFGQPVAIRLLGILQQVPDDDDPYGAVGRLIDAVPPGSFLVITHPASDVDPRAAAEGGMAARLGRHARAGRHPNLPDRAGRALGRRRRQGVTGTWFSILG
jgi:hypothetical protein